VKTRCVRGCRCHNGVRFKAKRFAIQREQAAFTAACAGDVTTFCNNVRGTLVKDPCAAEDNTRGDALPTPALADQRAQRHQGHAVPTASLADAKVSATPPV